MPDDFQNPNEEPADFSRYFEGTPPQSAPQSRQTETTVSPSASADKSPVAKKSGILIKRPIITIIVASVLLVIALTLLISFLNSPARRGQIKVPPLVVPKSSGQK